MAGRNSTSSTATTNRLRTKTTELSDFLRWRESTSQAPPLSNALSDSVLSDSASHTGRTAKSKRRIPFLGLNRKKPAAGTSAVPSPTPSTRIPSPSAIPIQKPPTSRLDTSARTSARSGAASPATLRPTRSITPTSQALSHAGATINAARGQNSPEITVSKPSPERRVPSRPGADSNLTLKPPSGSASDVDFPMRGLSDSEYGTVSSSRERKGSFLERFKGKNASVNRSLTVSTSTGSPRRAAASSSSSPSLPPHSHVRTPSHSSKVPSASSQELESVLQIGKGVPAVLPPSNPDTPTSASSARSSHSSSARNTRMPTLSGRTPTTSISSTRAPSVASVRASESSTPSPRLPPSKLGQGRSVARTTSIPGKTSPVRTAPPSSPSGAAPSWLLTRGPATKPAVSSGKDSPSTPRTKTPPPSAALRVPMTRARSSSDSRMLETAAATPASTSNAPSSLSTATGTKAMRASYHALPAAMLPSSAPPSGPLPAPPIEQSGDGHDVTPSSPESPSRSLNSMPSMGSSLSSTSASTSWTNNTRATTASFASASSVSRLPTIPAGAPLSTSSTTSASVTPPKKVSPPSSPTPRAPASSPLAPTPANIYALETENATLKARIALLERTARRQEREIRGLRWLVVNGNSAARPGAQSKLQITQQAPVSSVSIALSDSEGPLSDGTTDVGSARGLRGFESDTAALGGGAPYIARRQHAPSVYSSASDASGPGPELCARARSSALDRARAAREQAGRVLARSSPSRPGSIEFSVAVDLAAEVESAGGHADDGEVEMHGEKWEESRRSSESTTPTSPVSPVPSPPLARRPLQDDEARRQKEERRASRVLKRVSLIDVDAVSPGVDSRPKHSVRGQPSIEQVMDVEQELKRLNAVVNS